MATRKKKPATRSAKKAPRKAKAAPRKKAKAAPKKKAKAQPRRAAPSPPKAKPAQRPKAKKAPILWSFKTKATALGIYVDENLAWIGNQNGEIFAVNHQGEVQQQWKLEDGVKALIADDAWRYAGCDNGKVYDLTGRVPRLVYDTGNEILWLDIYRGNLAVSDDSGGITVVDAEDQLRWKKRDAKDGSGWMVRTDGAGVYHGGGRGISKYDWDGKKIWSVKTPHLLFGWQEPDTVYGGTLDGSVVVFGKDGKKGPVCTIPGSVPSCAASPGGKYIFGANSSSVFCFDESGKELWELATGCGAALSMQYFEERLYIVTGQGVLACIDVSEAAIERAAKGSVPKAVSRNAPKVEAQSTELEKTTDTSGGVVVECIKQGGKLRVRVLSDGYHKDWFCQFPKDVREEGAQYVVDKVLEAAQGGFYRVLGDIKRLG